MQKRNTQLTMKDIDARMVFGILVGVVLSIIAFPFLIVWALIHESLGSSKATGRSDDAPAIDNRPDVNGYKPGDYFYSKPGTINPVLIELWDTDNNKDLL